MALVRNVKRKLLSRHNQPASGKAGIARRLTTKKHWPGLLEPGRSATSRFMKISRVLFFICLALASFGCHQRSDDSLPSGSFRLVVEDMVKDETFRVVSLKILSSQPGMFSVSKESSHSACQLLIPAGQKLREGQMFFTASKATDSRTTNAYVLVSLQMKAEGGDGSMIGGASIHGGLGSTTYYPPKDIQLDVICNLTAKSGVYTLDAPLEIGRVDGKPVMLTVGKPL